jgi:molybdenum cofactor cytidylyltransferase
VAATIRALLLCGGASRRFGSDKLMAGAEPLALRSARALQEGAGTVLAVIPLGRPELRRVLEQAGCEILETDRTSRGMGASLAAGVESAASASGWIVALGDMPRVNPATIAAVRQSLEAGALIAAPFMDGRRGHPVGFSAPLRDELLALDGDIGARSILERHAHDIVQVEVRDPGIFFDVDTPEDLTPG